MIDKDASNFLKGCVSHNAPQTDNLDPEILSYFLVRRKFNSQSNDTASVSHQNPNTTQKHEARSTSRLKRHVGHRSSERSPRAPNSAKSGDSRGTKRKNGTSIGSSRSASSRYPNIKDWSAGIRTMSPSSFLAPQRNPIDPPRPPKSGYEWVWFPEGYWAEREIRGYMPLNDDPKQKWRNKSSAQRSPRSQKSYRSLANYKAETPPKALNPDTIPDNRNSLFFMPQIKIGSVSLKSTIMPSRQTSSQHTIDESRKSSSFRRLNIGKPLRKEASQPIQEREGLYYRTKRTLEKRLCKRSADKLSIRSLERPGNLASRTTILLHGASTYIDRAQHRSNYLAAKSPSPSSLEGRKRPRIGLAPWHRRHSNESLLSVTSSVRNILMGKTPIATPVAEKHYEGPDGMIYPTVQLASHDPYEPTFLPSEARRINTPPMDPDTPDIHSPDFLFDVSATGEGGSLSTGQSGRSPPIFGGTPKTPPPLSQSLWEAGSKNGNTKNKPALSLARSPPGDLISPRTFELNLPEHLPSSPLCPKNPKHQSGGIGVCVYHGRKKSVGLKQLERVSTGTEESSGLKQP